MRIEDGRQIKAARAILGITAMDLAKEVGLCKNSVLRVEGMKRIRRYAYDRNSSVARIERVIEAKGVLCEMQDGHPAVRFETTAVPPKYRRKVSPTN